MAQALLGVWPLRQNGRCRLLYLLRALGQSRDLSQASVNCLSAANDKLHVHLEPLEQEYEGIFALTLSNPKAANAIGRQLLRELREALDNVRRETTTRCLVVRSAVPKVFCAGADLKERATMSQQETAEFVTSLRATFSALEALPMPTVAVVDGYALGGGAEMALACDFRVGGPLCHFAFPETRLGIIPGAGGTQRLPRVVGRTKAKELIFTGRRIGVTEALEAGLLDYSTADSAAAEERGLQLAMDIAKGPTGAQSGPIALRMAKAAINQGLDVGLHAGLALEEACYAQVIPTSDRLEGLRAFAEKRPPQFTGT